MTIMKYSILLFFLFFPSVGFPQEQIFHVPFYGEKPFETNSEKISILNVPNLTVEKDGIVFGEGFSAPEIKVPGWNGKQGSVVFWIKPVSWEPPFEPVLMFFASLEGKGGWFQLYKYGADQLWLYGCEQTEGGKEQREVIFKYLDFKNWKKGEWHHCALVWEKDSFIKLYVDGKLANQREGHFAFPSSFEGVRFCRGSEKKGWGCAGKTALRDFYLATHPVSDSEILLLSRNHPEKASLSEEKEANVLPFTVTEKAPRIDGKIEKNEYSTKITGLLDTEFHTIYPDGTNLFTSVAKERLYLAASLKVPDSHQIVSASNVRDSAEQISGKDLFVLFIRSDSALEEKGFKGFYITIAPNGNIYDASEEIDWAKNHCVRLPEVNLDLEVKSSVTDNIWSLELSVPLKEVNLEADKSFLFSAGFKVGDKRLAFQDHPVWFDHYQAFSRGVFTPVEVKVDFGKLNQGVVSPSFDFLNNGTPSLSGKAGYVISRPEITETAASMVEEKKIGEELKIRTKDSLHDWEQAFSLVSLNRKQYSDSFILKEPDIYSIKARAEIADKTIYRQLLPFIYFSPISAELKPIPSRDQVKVILSLYGIEKDKVDKGNISFRSSSGKEFLNKTFPVTKKEEINIFSTASLPPGQYKTSVSLSDREGKEIAVRTFDFNKWETPQWLSEPKGLKALNPDWVPKPWVPLEMEGKNVSLWGRKFSFSDKAILDQIESQNAPLLTQAMAIRYISKGKIYSLPIEQTRVDQPGKGRVAVSQNGSSPDFTLNVLHTIEFDGMDLINVTIKPKKVLTIDSLYLEIPLQNIKYFYASPRWNLGLVKDQDFGEIYDLWLGNDDVGITCSVENYKGWVINSAKPRVNIKKEKDNGLSLKLLFINEPSEIEKPLMLTFILQPTPLKPFFQGWRQIRPQGMSWSPPPVNLYMTHPSRWSAGYSKPVPRSWKVLEDLIALNHKYNQKVYPYLTPFYISTYDMIKNDVPFKMYEGASEGIPIFTKDDFTLKKKDSRRTEEYFYFAEDWNLNPPKMTGDGSGNETAEMACCSPSSSWTDYFVGSVSEILTRTDLDGFYFDLAGPTKNFDESKGYAYRTKDGKLEGTVETLAARNLYKRLYSLFDDLRGENRKPYIIGHGDPIRTPTASFWDVQFHGEGMKPQQKFAQTAWYLQKNLVAPDRIMKVDPNAERDYEAITYRAMHPSKQIGLPMMLLPQYGYASLTDTALSREFLSFTFLHNNLLWPALIPPVPVYNFWNKVEIPFGMNNTVFHPYWNNSIKSSPEGIKSSYWKKEDKADYLVAIANWSEKELAAEIELPAEIACLETALDMESGEKMPCLPKMKIIIPAHDLRVFRFPGNF